VALARCSQRLPRPGGRLIGVTEFGWLLGREFGLLARELGRAHEMRGELQRAREIETALGRELEQLRRTLESSNPKPAAALDPETVAVGYIEPAEPHRVPSTTAQSTPTAGRSRRGLIRSPICWR
jgi:hypothetical protein